MSGRGYLLVFGFFVGFGLFASLWEVCLVSSVFLVLGLPLSISAFLRCSGVLYILETDF